MTSRSDNFTRADSSSSIGTPSDAGSAWVVTAGSTWGITTNRGYKVSAAGSFDVAYLEASTTSADAQATFVTLGNSGLVVRFKNDNNFIMGQITAGNAYIWKRVAGTFTQIGSTYTGSTPNGDTWKLSVNGSNNLVLSQNGTSRVTGTDAFNSTQTKHGLMQYDATGVFDDFSITDTAGGGAYTLTAAAGSYTLSGQDAALLAARTLAAGQGGYALTGQDAGLLFSRILNAGQGAYNLTGQSAILTYQPAGSYTLTASAGSYSITGQAAGLLVARAMAAAQGAYALSGQAATLTYTPAGASYTLTAAQGAYSITGQAAGLQIGQRRLTAAAGSYVLTGFSASLTYSGSSVVVQASIPASRLLRAGSARLRPAQSSSRSRSTQ